MMPLLLVASACWLSSEDVKLSFDNRTSSGLCYYPSSADAATSRCIAPVPTGDKTAYRPGCGDGPGADENLLTVVLTESDGGGEIYTKTAPCRDWKNSDRTLVIQQNGDNFDVTGGPP